MLFRSNEIYEHLAELRPRQAVLFREGLEQAELSRRLATIEQNVDICVYLENCVLKDFDKLEVTQVFKKYAFRSLIARLDRLKEDEQKSMNMQLDIFSTPVEETVWSGSDEINSFLKNCNEVVCVYVDTDESATGYRYVVVRGRKGGGEKHDFVCKEECFTIGLNSDYSDRKSVV